MKVTALDINVRLKKLQEDAVLAMHFGTDDQALSQINANNAALRKLITDILDSVVTEPSEFVRGCLSGSIDSTHYAKGYVKYFDEAKARIAELAL